MIAESRTASEAPLEKLTGTLDSIRSQRGGWMAGRLKVAGMLDTVSINGTCIAPQVGATYNLEGKWSTMESNGRTYTNFDFTYYSVDLPTEAEAIVDYLRQIAPGIGVARAWAIINEFGAESTMHVLKTDPELVAEKVKGLSVEKTMEVQATLVENERLEWVTLQLHGLIVGGGLGKATVKKAIDKWGHQAFDIVHTDPFILTELHGVGFLSADLVRAKIGISPEAPSRIRSGVIYVIREQCENNGHTFMRYDAFRKQILEALTIPLQIIEEALPDIKDVVVDKTELFGTHGYDIALRSTREAELNVAEKMAAMVSFGSSDHTIPTVNLEGLAEDQREAMAKVVRAKVLLLYGAPGVGKTYLVRRIIETFHGKRIALAAPTGKAAKRITELTGVDACTIHRLLQATHHGGGEFYFGRSDGNLLEESIVIIDEASMVDIHLMSSLCDAIPLASRLILIGDTNQLASVGPGNVLRDLIRSGIVETAELTTIKRQDAGDIVRNTHRIRDGKNIVVDNRSSEDFFWQEHENEQDIQDAIVDLVCNRLPKHNGGCDPVTQIQVLCATNSKGLLSCKTMNEVLQRHLNCNKPENGLDFAVCDKVIQTFNDYENNVFNGELGIVIEIEATAPSDSDWTMTVRFEGGREVKTKALKTGVKLAYAITIHRSQGSEWKIVVMPVHKSQPAILMQRNLLYTGISRAQQTFVGVGQKNETAKIIGRQSNLLRQTKLETFLRAAAV